MMAPSPCQRPVHLIMEVSSQAYLQKRVYGLTFDVGAYSQYRPDHIIYIEHPTFEIIQ